MATQKKKKRNSKPRRKQCETEGCRKLAKPGVGLCAPCEKAQHEAQFPIDGVVKISAVRAMRWDVLETRLRNYGQGVKILVQEMELAKRDFQAAQAARVQKKDELVAAAQAATQEYQDLTKAIADELGLDHKQMSIDPDTRVVRDLRKKP